MQGGRLTIRPLSANLKKSTDFFKMDPYLVITIGNQKQQTRTCNGGGKKPTWSDSLSFNLDRHPDMMDVVCFDKDTFSKDDYVAEAHISIYDMVSRQRGDEWYPMFRKGKDSGKILIAFEFIPTGGPGAFVGGYAPQQPVGYMNSYANQHQFAQAAMNTMPGYQQPMGMGGYPPQGPPFGMGGYPPQGPPFGMGGYPPQGPPMGMGGYPPQGPGGFSPYGGGGVYRPPY